jgi:hypothetical protein
VHITDGAGRRVYFVTARERRRYPQHADADADAVAAAVLRETDAGHPAAAEQIAIDAQVDGLTRPELEALVTPFHVDI